MKEVLPGFDGRRLDDLVDFLNYTCLPLLLIYQADLLPERQSGWLLVPLLASAYGFCQVSAKTDDGFFLGFPSYWNLVAFYIYALQPPVWGTVTLLMTFSALTFVPARYLYPTQPGALNRISIILGGIWGAFLVAIVWRWDHEPFTGTTAQRLNMAVALLPGVLPGSVVGAVGALLALRAKKRCQEPFRHSPPEEIRAARQELTKRFLTPFF